MNSSFQAGMSGPEWMFGVSQEASSNSASDGSVGPEQPPASPTYQLSTLHVQDATSVPEKYASLAAPSSSPNQQRVMHSALSASADTPSSAAEQQNVLQHGFLSPGAAPQTRPAPSEHFDRLPDRDLRSSTHGWTFQPDGGPSHSHGNTGGAAVAEGASSSVPISSPMTSGTALPATDLTFGPHRITVSGPPMSHQRVDLYPDGTVTTMSRPVPGAERDDHPLNDGAATPSGKSHTSSSRLPPSAPWSPVHHRPSTPTGDLSAADPRVQPQSPSGASGAPAGSTSSCSTPVVQTRPAWSTSAAGAAPASPLTPSFASPVAAPPEADASQPADQRQRSLRDGPMGKPPTDGAAYVYTPQSSTPYNTAPYNAASTPYSGTPQQYGVMGTPVPGPAWTPTPASNVHAAPAATSAHLQAFGSLQADSPPQAPKWGNAEQPGRSQYQRPGSTQQQLRQHQEHAPWTGAQLHPASPRPAQLSPRSQSTGRPGASVGSVAAGGGGGQGLQGTPGGSAASKVVMTEGAQASGGAAPSGGNSSGCSPTELRNKYRRAKQQLLEYVREIDSLKERLTSEGRRTGILGTQIAALQGQMELAGDSVALLAATQAEKMVAVQKLRETREHAESLQGQLSIAQAQVRALEQQQTGMLNEFAAERQRREAQFMEERQKLEAARAEEQSQKLAYLAAFHEDRERWETAAAEQRRALQAECEEKIAAALEEHKRQAAAAKAEQEATMQRIQAQAQATAEAANTLVQRAKAQAAAATEAAEAAAQEARAQAAAATEAAEAAVQEARAQAAAAAQAAEAAARDARAQIQAAEVAIAQQAKAELAVAVEAAEAEVARVRAQARAAVEAAEEEVSRIRGQAKAAVEAAEAEADRVRSQAQALTAAQAEALTEARRRHAAEMEEARKQHGAELEEARRQQGAELEEARRQHAAELERIRQQHAAQVEEARGRHREELADVRARHVQQLAEAEEALTCKTAELRELRARLADSDTQRRDALATLGAREAQLQAQDRQLQELAAGLRDREAELQALQGALTTTQGAAAAAQRDANLRVQALNQEVELLQTALDDAREMSRKATQMASDTAARLAAAEARLAEAPLRQQERVEAAVRQAQEEHRQHLSGVVQRVQHNAQQQLLEIRSAATEATEALSGELEVQHLSTRREMERVTALLDSRNEEVATLRTSLERATAERDKLMATAGELQEMVVKVQQRMEKQEKKHARALERAQSHREQQVARLQEELEAIRASVPGRVERALQSYASQLASNQQAAVAAVEARAAAALQADRSAAEVAIKRAREEAEGECRQRLAAQQTLIEEVRQRLQERAEAAEAAVAAARAQIRELDAAARAAGEAEAELRARLAEAERRYEERRVAVEELERQVQEARKQMELAARQRTDQLQGVFAVLAQLGLTSQTLETIAGVAAATAVAAEAVAAGQRPGAYPPTPWSGATLASAPAPLSPLHTPGPCGSSSSAAAIAAAAAAAVAANSYSHSHASPYAPPPPAAVLAGLREQLAAALLPPGTVQQQHQQHPTHQQGPFPKPHPVPGSAAGSAKSQESEREVAELRRRLQEARAEALVYRRKIEAGVQRERDRERRRQQHLHTDRAERAGMARSRSFGAPRDGGNHHRRSGTTKQDAHARYGYVSDPDADLGCRGGLFLGSDVEIDSCLDMGLDLDLDHDQGLRRRGGAVRRRRSSGGGGGGRRRRSLSIDLDTLDLEGSMPYSDGGGGYCAERRRPRRRDVRFSPSSSDDTEDYGSRRDSSRRDRERRGKDEDRRRGLPATPGSRYRRDAEEGGRRGGAGGSGDFLGGAVQALKLRVQQLALELRAVKAREAQCVEAARRADSVLLLLHGAASRAQLLLAGAPRQQDQELANELSDALSRASRHRQNIARLEAEAEAVRPPTPEGRRAGGYSSGVGGEASLSGRAAAGTPSGHLDPSLVLLREVEQHQAAAATLAAQLTVARNELAEAVTAGETLRGQLQQQAEGHAAELQAARAEAATAVEALRGQMQQEAESHALQLQATRTEVDAALAQAAQLSSQVVEARSQQQALQAEAQALRRQLRGYGAQVRQFLDDLVQEVSLVDLSSLAQQVLTATERALGLWTIREHDHLQATRRAVAGLRRDADECRQLMHSLAAATQQATRQAAARSRTAAVDMARVQEQGAQEVAALRRRHEEQMRQLVQEKERLAAAMEALKADKDHCDATVAALQQRLVEGQAALEAEQQSRRDLEGRMQGVVAQAVRLAEAQRDAAQAAAVAAAERELNEANGRAGEAAQRCAELKEQLQRQREQDAAHVRDQQRRHEAALQELQQAHEAALLKLQQAQDAGAGETAQLLCAAAARTQAAQEEAAERDAALRQQEEELEGLRAVLQDAEEQLVAQAEALRQRETELDGLRAVLERREELEKGVRQREKDTEGLRAVLRDAEEQLAEARAAARQAERRAEAAEAAEADAVRRLADAEARRTGGVAEAEARAAEAREAARGTEAEVARLKAEAKSYKEAAASASAALAAAAAAPARRAPDENLGRQLEAVREGLHMAEARARAAEAEAAGLAAALEEARRATRSAQEATEAAVLERQAAADRVEELLLELRAVERRLEAARTAALLQDQQLAAEQAESDRLRSQLRLSQARVAELQQAVVAVATMGGSGGGASSVSAGSGGGAGRVAGPANVRSAAVMAGGDSSVGGASAISSIGGAFSEGGASRHLGSGGGVGGAAVGLHSAREQSHSSAKDRMDSARQPASSLIPSPAPVPPTVTSDFSPALLLSQNSPSPARFASGASSPSGMLLGYSESLFIPVGATAYHLQQLGGSGSPQPPPPSLDRDRWASSGSAGVPPPSAPRPKLLTSMYSEAPEGVIARQDSARSQQPAVVPSELQKLLAEVGRHCQRLPAINQVLDTMLLPSLDATKTSYAPGSEGGSSSGSDGGRGSSSHDDFLRSPAAAAALEHLVEVMGGALRLVAQLEDVVATRRTQQQAHGQRGQQGEGQDVEVETALAKHRRQIEETWSRVSQAQRLMARRSAAGVPRGAGVGSEGSAGRSQGADDPSGPADKPWAAAEESSETVGTPESDGAEGGSAGGAWVAEGDGDDDASFRGFLLSGSPPSARGTYNGGEAPKPVGASVAPVLTSATAGDCAAKDVPAAEAAPVSANAATVPAPVPSDEPATDPSSAAQAVAAARAELARALLADPLPSSSSCSSLPMPQTFRTQPDVRHQSQQLKSVQSNSPALSAPLESESQPPPRQQQRLSLADLVAPRQSGESTAPAAGPVAATPGGRSPAGSSAAVESSSQNPSPEPQPRPPPLLLMPMPMLASPAKGGFATEQPQQHLQPESRLQWSLPVPVQQQSTPPPSTRSPPLQQQQQQSPAEQERMRELWEVERERLQERLRDLLSPGNTINSNSNLGRQQQYSSQQSSPQPQQFPPQLPTHDQPRQLGPAVSVLPYQSAVVPLLAPIPLAASSNSGDGGSRAGSRGGGGSSSGGGSTASRPDSVRSSSSSGMGLTRPVIPRASNGNVTAAGRGVVAPPTHATTTMPVPSLPLASASMNTIGAASDHDSRRSTLSLHSLRSSLDATLGSPPTQSQLQSVVADQPATSTRPGRYSSPPPQQQDASPADKLSPTTSATGMVGLINIWDSRSQNGSPQLQTLLYAQHSPGQSLQSPYQEYPPLQSQVLPPAPLTRLSLSMLTTPSAAITTIAGTAAAVSDTAPQLLVPRLYGSHPQEQQSSQQQPQLLTSKGSTAFTNSTLAGPDANVTTARGGPTATSELSVPAATSVSIAAVPPAILAERMADAATPAPYIAPVVSSSSTSSSSPGSSCSTTSSLPDGTVTTLSRPRAALASAAHKDVRNSEGDSTKCLSDAGRPTTGGSSDRASSDRTLPSRASECPTAQANPSAPGSYGSEGGSHRDAFAGGSRGSAGRDQVNMFSSQAEANLHTLDHEASSHGGSSTGGSSLRASGEIQSHRAGSRYGGAGSAGLSVSSSREISGTRDASQSGGLDAFLVGRHQSVIAQGTSSASTSGGGPGAGQATGGVTDEGMQLGGGEGWGRGTLRPVDNRRRSYAAMHLGRLGSGSASVTSSSGGGSSSSLQR